ncbi:MAG: hypothetical protein ACOCX4_01375 [Planctomycetota bacterium]
MRKLVVLVVLVVFGAYCVLAHQERIWYAVPGYETVQLDILGGATPTQWNAEAYGSRRYDRLNELARRGLQPAEIPPAAQGLGLAPDRPLQREDYEALVAAGVTELPVRDPARIAAFADKRLHARQNMTTAEGEVVVTEGAELDKAAIDRLLAAGLDRVAVVGSGDVVGFNATVFLVVLIFVGMTVALMDIFWDPMTALIDRRTAEIREGAQCLRTNRLERERIEREREDGLREVHQDYQTRLRAARQKTFAEVDAMVDKATNELKGQREQTARERRKALAEAEEQLRAETPALAREALGHLRSQEG